MYADFDLPKIQKIAQLQEIKIFTCNLIKNEDTSHELPRIIYKPKQDRKIWVIKAGVHLNLSEILVSLKRG